MKMATDRSFVLHRERKCTKKGRPSSKKQRKRNREKRKSEAANSNESSLIFSITINENTGSEDVANKLKKMQVSVSNDSISFVDKSSSQTEKSDFDIYCSPGEQTYVASQAQEPSRSNLACIFISEPNEGTDDDSENSTDTSDCCSDEEWASDGSDDDSINFNGSIGGLGIALSLDAIFKKKNVPSLKSVLQGNETCTHKSSPNSFTVLVPSPSNSSLEDSVCFSPGSESDYLDLSSSPVAQTVIGAFAGLSQGLCLDSILSGQQEASPSKKFSSTTQTESKEVEGVDKRLREINNNWNELYETAGFRSCFSSHPIIKHPDIKVCFVDDAHLATVHEVGSEERKGIWEQFVVDRNRFAKRIKEVSKVLSPILNSKHRETVYERNASLTSDENC